MPRSKKVSPCSPPPPASVSNLSGIRMSRCRVRVHAVSCSRKNVALPKTCFLFSSCFSKCQDKGDTHTHQDQPVLGFPNQSSLRALLSSGFGSILFKQIPYTMAKFVVDLRDDP